MSRRLAAFVLLAALAVAGSAAFALSRDGGDACTMGKGCPMKGMHGSGRCPAKAAWSVELGCCAPAPVAPTAPAPTVACPLEGGADASPALLGAAIRCPAAARQCDLSRERSRAARLHDLGLFTLISVFLI